MTSAKAIRKLGFKRWYERQLIESHLYLVSCFLCMVLVAVCLEELSLDDPGRSLTRFLLIASLVAGGAWVGLRSWQRFKGIFTHAMVLGEASTCGGCGAYARFEVTGSGVEWLHVQCRKCGHEWTMP